MTRAELEAIRAIVREELERALGIAGRCKEPPVGAVHVPPPCSHGGYVYFAHAPATRAVKIGVSRDIYKRMNVLRTGAPHRLDLFGAYWIPDPKSEESGLHRRFRHHHIRNEWFVADQEILAFATWAATREYLGPPLEALITVQ